MSSLTRIKKAKIKFLLTLGEILGFIGEGDRSQELYEEALNLSHIIGDKLLMASANRFLGVLFWRKGIHDLAMKYYEKSLGLYEEIKNKYGISAVMGNIGLIYYEKNDFDTAMNYFSRHLKLSQEIGNKEGEAMAISNIGIIYFDKGNYDAAMDYYLKGLEIDKERGDLLGIGFGYDSIAEIYYERGDYSNAESCFKKSLKLFEKIGNCFWISWVNYCMGKLYQRKNENEKAMNYYNRAIKSGKELEMNHWLSEYLLAKARLLFYLEKIEEAKFLNDECLSISQNIQRRDIIFGSKILSVKINFAMGNKDANILLYQMLSDTEDDKETAILHYEIWKMETGKQKQQMGRKALELYQKLEENALSIEYKQIIEELSKKYN